MSTGELDLVHQQYDGFQSKGHVQTSGEYWIVRSSIKPGRKRGRWHICTQIQFPQVGVKINKIWNHRLVRHRVLFCVYISMWCPCGLHYRHTLSPIIMVQWNMAFCLKGNDPVGDTPIFDWTNDYGRKCIPNGFSRWIYRFSRWAMCWGVKILHLGCQVQVLEVMAIHAIKNFFRLPFLPGTHAVIFIGSATCQNGPTTRRQQMLVSG